MNKQQHSRYENFIVNLNLKKHIRRFPFFLYLLAITTCSPIEATEAEKVLPTSTTITLTWTASGDDRLAGRASYYDIRYALTPINDFNWNSAYKVINTMIPNSSGTAESFVVKGLLPNTSYYFAIKVADEFPNWSKLSNVVKIKTALPPICGDIDESGVIDISDLVYCVDFMFGYGALDFYHNVVDLDLSGDVDITDLTYFVSYFFGNGPEIECPVSQVYGTNDSKKNVRE